MQQNSEVLIHRIYCMFLLLLIQVEIMSSEGTDMALCLVDFAEQHDQPIITLYRFYMICSRGFNSTCCLDHGVHHNGPGAAAAAAAETLLIIENVNGWPSVEGTQLPPDFLQNVQVSCPTCIFLSGPIKH